MIHQISKKQLFSSFLLNFTIKTWQFYQEDELYSIILNGITITGQQQERCQEWEAARAIVTQFQHQLPDFAVKIVAHSVTVLLFLF